MIIFTYKYWSFIKLETQISKKYEQQLIMQQQHRRGFESSKCDIEGIVAKNCVKDISLRQALEKKQRETTTRGSSTQIGN